MKLKRLQSVSHKHGDSHGPYSARNGCYGGGNLRDGVKIHIAAELAVNPVYADVYYNGALLYHIGRHETGAPYGGNENIGASRNIGKVRRPRVTDCDGSVCVKKKHRLGFAHNIASADNRTFLTRRVYARKLYKLHYACGSAGQEIIIANHYLADIDGMKGVYILRGVDRKKYFLFVNGVGQWKLTEYSVNISPFV